MSNAAQDKALHVGASRIAHLVYRVTRRVIRAMLFPWFRLRATGREHLDIDGPVIVAPVHRSNLDSLLVAALGERRMRALAKESLFSNPVIGWYVAALGAFPLNRDAADREAMRTARRLLDADEMMFVFPEGTRRSGRDIAPLFDGTAYLAAKTHARVVPVAIVGTDLAMPKGARFPRRTRVRVVVRPPLDPPPDRARRSELSSFTESLRRELTAAMDEAHDL